MNHLGSGKNPCTLQQAISLLGPSSGKGIRKEVHQGTETTYTTTTRSVDLLAVVVRLSTRTSRSPVGEVWVVDETLGKRNHALVSFYGNNAVLAIQEKKLRVGSMVRFNGVKLRRMMEQTASSNSSRTYEFLHSWEYPPIGGVEWWELGRVTSKSNGILSRQGSSRIPQGMETSTNQIQQLLRWYRQSKFFRENHHSDHQQLSPLPCQRRSLEEMQSSLGIVSHVMVRKIVRVETLLDTSSPNKKRRLSSPPPTKITVATVSDGCHTVMPLLLLRSHYGLQAKLQKALERGNPVLLHSVVCRKGRDVLSDEQQKALEDVKVLVPTSKTDLVLLSQKAFPRTEPQMTQTQHQQHASTTQTQDVSVPTQQPELSVKERQQTKSITVVEGHIEAIEFPDMGMELPNDNNKSSLPSPMKLLSLLTHFQNGQDYREAIVRIVVVQTHHTRVLRIHADAKGMRNLAGGLKAKELKERPQLLSHVRDWLEGLLEDKTCLRWRLVEEDSSSWDYRLQKVTLIEL
ncbi:expressed unknown protein [Seminavis robusta]|uniref:Telomeric single stranded DNA binding POT1/Cdc13 domain-containing protein n=1 Tax=Seminavis robusta TaxID=568900 RepID=A0A9N8HRP2_9STRA|nr:expressed unknown protein [Seminavis robusta]|eukprot:Sro1600_g285070.1 n/a (516) ;mRNA; r:16515-18062